MFGSNGALFLSARSVDNFLIFSDCRRRVSKMILEAFPLQLFPEDRYSPYILY